jgi:signal transduction histidine kinase
MLLNAVRREREQGPVSECVFVRMLQRNEFEDQLVEARRAAEEASSAKSKFLSMMSHDLRTPLTAIRGNTDLLMREVLGPVTADQLDALGSIKYGCHELLRMIDDILTFAHLDSHRVRVAMTTVPVQEAMERAAVLMRVQMAESGLTFDIRSAPEWVAVYADPDRLQQILLNLLANAVKYTPRGGIVSTTYEATEEHVRIHVRDTGIGIAADQLTHIFEPFVQLNQMTGRVSDSGIGLGLAISRELARAMGGDLTVSSTLGEGSVFTIELQSAAVTAMEPVKADN